MRVARNFLFLLLAGTLSLSRADAEAADASSTQEAKEAPRFQAGTFQFYVPAGWRAVRPVSPMRQAQLYAPSLPGTDSTGEPLITVFHFGPGQGGTVEQNVDRWFGQFDGGNDDKDAATAKETIGTVPVTFVRARGTFQSGMPGQPVTPLSHQSLLGAILESPQGDVYLKMVGPSSATDQAESAFVQMIRAACSP